MDIEYFDSLISKGLRVIPLHQNSKVPMGKKWNTRSWDINKIRKKFIQHPDSNIGILLGNIIDVEGDTEGANRLLDDLIGDYPHPLYVSTRSTHHLFITPDPKLKIFKFQNIEFRGYGHQSVLPPSEFYGKIYRWLSTAQFPVPGMPKRLLKFYHKITGFKDDIKPTHIKIYCAKCGKKYFLHRKRWLLELKAFQQLSLKWECQKCRSVDLRPLCRVLKHKFS